MAQYVVGMQTEKQEKFYFIREKESMNIVLLPSKYLMHKKRSKISPNTIRRSAFALSYYLNYMDENQLHLDDIYQMKYAEQHEHFTEFLIWLKAGEHSREEYSKLPNNETCNAYLKEVFRFYTFMERENGQSESLKVLSDAQTIVRNSIGVRRVLNRKSFHGYLKEKGHQGKTIEQDKIVSLLVSGHACREELRLIYALTKPKYAIPVHGEYRHLMRHRELAIEMGIPKENAFVLAEGDVLELNKRQGKIAGKVQAGGILVDGLGVGDVGNIVLNDRKLLSQNGLIIATVTLQKHGNMILAGPDIVSRGFVYVRESESLMEGARDVARDAVEECLERNITDWARIKTKIKDELSNYIWKKTKRNPMILPIITEV